MKTLKFWRLVWVYYPTSFTSRGLIIVAIWAPNSEDIGTLRNAQILNQAGYDIFVPEYYGFSRSIGSFSPDTSLLSLLHAIDIFSSWIFGYDVYSWDEFARTYDEIILIGTSYGGGLVVSVPQYRKNIRKVGLFYPLLSYIWLQSSGYSEESGEDFLQSILHDYSYLYHWMDEDIWRKYFSGELVFPISSDDIWFLSNTSVFMTHGMSDRCIHFSRTESFYEKLHHHFSDNDWILLKLYEWLWHGDETLLVSSRDFISWLDSI